MSAFQARQVNRAVAALLVVLMHVVVTTAIIAAEPPNILLIVADDLGWSDVGWHGGPYKTPHMDELVRTGVELDQHYVQPVCTPTRTALLSGRYPGRFGPQALAPSNLRAMPPGTVTLAVALKSLGYATYQTGKWHLGSRQTWGPNHYGFDHGYGTLTGAADPWTHKYRPGPYEDTWHRNGQRLDETGNATELVAAQAERHIRQAQQPWLVYVPFHAVHTPVDAPDEYKRLYDGVRFHADLEKHDSRLRLAAMVSQLDAKIGQLTVAVNETKQRENTLIVFTSDNGGIESLQNAYAGEVGHSPLNSENDPLRSEKNTLYEGGIRVCAFANWPGRLACGKFTAPMHAVDWFPTLAGLAGYVPSHDLHWDGIDQWPAMSGASAANEDRLIYIAMQNGGRALRQNGWKLIVPRRGPHELYHLADDPYEKRDLAEAEPATAERLRQLLNQQAALDEPNVPADLAGLPK